jgi:hypothetical protein
MIRGLGFTISFLRVESKGFRVEGLEFRVSHIGLGVKDRLNSVVRIYDLGVRFRVQGLGVRGQVSGERFSILFRAQGGL